MPWVLLVCCHESHSWSLCLSRSNSDLYIVICFGTIRYPQQEKGNSTSSSFCRSAAFLLKKFVLQTRKSSSTKSSTRLPAFKTISNCGGLSYPMQNLSKNLKAREEGGLYLVWHLFLLINFLTTVATICQRGIPPLVTSLLLNTVENQAWTKI